MSNPAIKVAVYVQGGVVTGVSTDGPSLVDVIVVDYDDAVDFEGDYDNADERTAAFEESMTFADGASATSVDLYPVY